MVVLLLRTLMGVLPLWNLKNYKDNQQHKAAFKKIPDANEIEYMTEFENGDSIIHEELPSRNPTKKKQKTSWLLKFLISLHLQMYCHLATSLTLKQN